MTAGRAQGIAMYQARCADMVAPKGQRLAGPGSLKKEQKARCTRPVDRVNGHASRTLARREAKLQARLRDYMSTINSNKDSSTGYRKPGSMKK